MIELTEREWMVLTCITTYRREHGYAPSVNDIAKSIGKRAGGGITGALRRLEGKGVITFGRKNIKCRQERAIGLIPGVWVGVNL